jgi:DNA invertase Pin-like site-specific DNA recombinase
MAIRRIDGLLELVLKGYKPYYHRGVNRWYLRRGNRRILIDRNLNRVAKEIHKALEYLKMRREAIRKELIRRAIELRASGATIKEVVKVVGVLRSTLYRYLQPRLYISYLYCLRYSPLFQLPC